MKKIILLLFIFNFYCAAALADYVPVSSNSSPSSFSSSSLNEHNTSHYNKIGDYTYSPSGVYYSKDYSNNKIYGSDGSQYTQYGNVIQDNSTGKQYQINNNIIEPLFY